MSVSRTVGVGSLRPQVCTSTTRPINPYDGQFIYETNTGAVRWWNGSTLTWDAPLVGATGPAGPTGPTGAAGATGPGVTTTAWTAVTFQNSWTNYGAGYNAAQYRKVGDVVQIRGLVAGGTVGATIFTLPAGFWPPARLLFAVDTASNAHGRIDVEATAGLVIAQSVSNTYLGINVSFSVTA